MVGFVGKIFEATSGEGEDGAHVGKRLREIRERAGLTQVRLAERLGMHQSALSRIESQSDVLVSTLRGYIEGLGAKLRIDARFENPNLRISQFEEAGVAFAEADENQLCLPIFEEDTFPHSRDVVFSIRPQYSEKIQDGRKTVELRRRFPVNVPTGTIALIYSTSPTRALTGIAEIERVTKSSPADIWQKFSRQTCVARADFESYFAGLDAGFAIKLRRARPLRRPIDLAELRDRFSFEPPQSFLYAKPQLRKALNYECSDLPY
jgi:predicted transcriptional regulator